jgi:hypothetical protein
MPIQSMKIKLSLSWLVGNRRYMADSHAHGQGTFLEIVMLINKVSGKESLTFAIL